FFFSRTRRHTIVSRDWLADVCSSDLLLRRYFGGLCVEAVRALHYVPAVVAAALDYADLLPQVLPSVGNLVLAGLGVPRGTPRVRSEERRVGKDSSTEGLECLWS